MKILFLRDLQEIIHSSLTLIDHSDECNWHYDVWCYSDTFEKFKDYEIIGLRCDDSNLIISIKEYKNEKI